MISPKSENFISIIAVSMVAKSVQQTANFCYQRNAFGGPLLNNQVIQFRLAELLTEGELLRSLIYRATGMICLLMS